VTDDPAAGPAEQPELPVGIDRTRPHQARVYDYWLGGKNNFAVDRDPRRRHGRQGLPPGQPRSWLAIFHPASDILTDQMSAVARQVSVRATVPTTLRTKEEIMHFFDGLEFLEPGLVQVHRWRPGPPAPDTGDEVPGYAGLARKP
jgi:truncated hemoglobin YjbI